MHCSQTRPLLLRIVCKHALFYDSETQPPNNRSYNHRLKQKARCRSNRHIHIQSNVIIHIKYIISSPDSSVPSLPLRSPSDQDNLTPFRLPLLSPIPSILEHSGIIPTPLQSPTSEHSGPNPHQMLTQKSKMLFQDFQYTTPSFERCGVTPTSCSLMFLCRVPIITSSFQFETP